MRADSRVLSTVDSSDGWITQVVQKKNGVVYVEKQLKDNLMFPAIEHEFQRLLEAMAILSNKMEANHGG